MTTKSAPTLAQLRTKREQILALAEKYGAYNVRVVGSVARGDATPDSDVDLLISVPLCSVFELVGLWLDLREMLGYEVSIIPDTAADPAFMASVQEDAIRL